MSEVYNSIYFVTGGGTGGHIYPAMAVADTLTESGAKVYYVGNKRNMEFELASKKGYKFLHVSVSGMPRKLNPKFFVWGVKLVKAILRSVRYIKKYKPNAVFATGGYVSAPMIFACRITKTPYIMHDCDAMPGLVTRKLSKRAKYVTLAFEKAKKYIPNKHTVITGNPIRAGFRTMTKAEAKANMGLENRLTLCIMGGSQGAKTINESAVKIIKDLSQKLDIQVIFQTGKRNFETAINEIEKIYPEYKEDKNLIIRPYFEDMVTVLKACDIAISRAGSLSISELCASNVATIFIPYPYAAQDHQRKNAKYMVENGAGLYLENSDTTPEKLFDMINSLVQDKTKMEAIQNAASKMAKFDGVQNIIKQIKSAIGSKN